MLKRRTGYLIVSWIVTLVCGLPDFALPSHHAGEIQNNVQWTLFVPPDEEFTAMVPALPTMRNYPVNNNPRDTHEKVLAHREYGGYGDGVIFIVDSFKAEHPEKLTGGLLSLVDENAVFQRLQFDGITAELFRGPVTRRDVTYTKNTLKFTTGKHLYVIALMTLDENNPGVDRFLSSLALRKTIDQVTSNDRTAEEVTSNIFKATEVTRRAAVIWKSEPFYTTAARAHRVVGTVSLQAVLGENGYVTNITIISGLKDGLTEAAIDAARNIRFFPAQKDGRPVSQTVMLEFGFDVY